MSHYLSLAPQNVEVKQNSSEAFILLKVFNSTYISWSLLEGVLGARDGDEVQVLVLEELIQDYRASWSINYEGHTLNGKLKMGPGVETASHILLLGWVKCSLSCSISVILGWLNSAHVLRTLEPMRNGDQSKAGSGVSVSIQLFLFLTRTLWTWSPEPRVERKNTTLEQCKSFSRPGRSMYLKKTRIWQWHVVIKNLLFGVKEI